VTTLENAPKFSVGGTVSATYGRLAVINGGVNFDVDRLVNGTGVSFGDGDVTTSNDTNDAVARSNGAYSTAGVTFGVKASNLATTNGAIVVNNAAINFGVNNAANLAGGDVLVKLNDASANGTISGQKFDVTYEAGTSNYKFNDYLFSSSGDGDFSRRGLVGNIEATQLPFAPKITFVTGIANGAVVTKNIGTTTAPVIVTDTNATRLSGNYYGIRASVNPAGLGTVGISFAQNDNNRSAYGVDYDVKAGPVSIVGAWVNSFPSTPANFAASDGGTIQNAVNNRDQAFYTNVKAGFGGISVAANYRAIDPQFAGGVAGMSGTTDLAPYGADQVGFGGAAAANIGIIAVSGYGDSRTSTYTSTGATRINNFGVAAGVKFGALSAKGFYNNSTNGGKSVGVDTASNNQFDGVAAAYMGTAAVPYQFSSTVGGVITHDGSATGALIPNLSFTVADAYFYNLRRDNTATPATGDTSAATANDLQVYGSYTATLGGVKIAPFARYHLFTTSGGSVFDANTNGTTVAAVPPSTTPTTTYVGIGTNTYNNIKYGVQLSTQPFTGVPLQPSLFANFSNRIGNPGTVVADRNSTSSTELLGQVGLTLNQFLAPNLKATVGYSYYQGFRVSSPVVALGADAYSTTIDRVYGGAGATNPLAGANFGTANLKAQGVFGQLDWNGLAANYGVFRNTDLNTNTTSIAQGFKVSYKFTF
jgi:hypothetical protein